MDSVVTRSKNQGRSGGAARQRSASPTCPQVLVLVLALPLSSAWAQAQDAAPHGGREGQTTSGSALAQTLLLDGVRAFRAEHFEDALRLFRQAESEQQPADIGFYLGTTLHKLGRHLEALGAFRSAHRGGLREPVADYYQAVSCYRLGMLARARQDFLALVGRPLQAGQSGQPATAAVPVLGPRLHQGAQSFLSAVEQSLAEAGGDAGQRSIGRLRRYEAARLSAEGYLTVGNNHAALEWLDEAARLLAEVPERAEKLPALRLQISRLRASLQDQSAEADIQALEARLGT